MTFTHVQSVYNSKLAVTLTYILLDALSKVAHKCDACPEELCTLTQRPQDSTDVPANSRLYTHTVVAIATTYFVITTMTLSER